MRIEIEVPEERIGAVIGKDGEVKKKIEEKCGCKLQFHGNLVLVDFEDNLSFMKAKNVILAIARGFSPEIALKLLEDENLVFETFDLSQLVSDSSMKRIMGRIIGKEGKMRKQIEDTLNVHMRIQERYISVIGDYDSVSIVREAINMLIDGAQHSTVLKFIEKRKRELKGKSLDWL